MRMHVVHTKKMKLSIRGPPLVCLVRCMVLFPMNARRAHTRTCACNTNRAGNLGDYPRRGSPVPRSLPCTWELPGNRAPSKQQKPQQSRKKTWEKGFPD
jgi:hypothetical protein